MRLLAYAFYVIAALMAVVGAAAVIGLGREYGWELDPALGWIPVVVVAVGLPTWIGTLFHRRARRLDRPQPNG